MELLESCRNYAHKFYGDLLMAAEKSLADVLLKQAEDSKSNSDQRQYFEAIQQLSSRGGAMHTCFSQELAKSYQAFVSGKDEESSLDEQLDATSLSLVKRDELEDELAISVIVSKSNSRNSESLWKLNRRMAVLRGGKTVTDETNPFGPAKVCQALQLAVHQLGVESKAKILIYKHLGKLFILSFGKSLDKLNDLFVEKGVLPNLKFVVGREKADSSGPPVGQDTGEEALPESPDSPTQGYGESAASINHQRTMFNAIRAMQHASGPRTHTAGGVSWSGIATDGSGGVDTFAPVDYALILSAIQQSKDFLNAASLGKPLDVERVEKHFVEQLTKSSDPNAHHKMASDDADTVDLVGMIFRYMLDDKNLHASVKSLLSHLHTPYLKLALMDKTFLENYEHSARLLLNLMAEVGGRWVEDEQDRTVLPKIKTIVETILKGFIDDVSIFDRLLEDFSRFKDSREKRAKMVEQRNTQAQQGLEKLEISKQRAADEVESRLDDKGIPDAIRDILQQPWTHFLSFNLLRHGEDSLTWQSALKVIDGVIWSVTPAGSGNDKEAFRQHQQEFETSVKEGLAAIGYDQEATETLLSSLKEAQQLAYHSLVMQAVPKGGANKARPIDSSSVAAEPITKQAQPVAKEKIKPKAKVKKPKKEEKLTAEEQTLVEKLKDIAFGTWFEFHGKRGSNDIRKLKLAWFSRVTLHYMFVDQSGMKQAVENRISLAKGMCEGRIRVIEFEKRSFMERALGAILDKLNLTD
jgi:hypothetical protein